MGCYCAKHFSAGNFGGFDMTCYYLYEVLLSYLELIDRCFQVSVKKGCAWKRQDCPVLLLNVEGRIPGNHTDLMALD